MWYRKLKHIPWQNRSVECIVDENNNIVIECELLNLYVIEHIIAKHADAVHEAYKEGIYAGIEIKK